DRGAGTPRRIEVVLRRQRDPRPSARLAARLAARRGDGRRGAPLRRAGDVDPSAVRVGGGVRMTRVRSLGDRFLDPALATNAGVVLAFLYLPMAVLLVFSFSASKYASVWDGFSTKWYDELTKDRALLDALGNSVVIGLAVAALSTALGTTT